MNVFSITGLAEAGNSEAKVSLAAFMSIGNTVNSHKLLDAVTILCSSGKSGRLQIAAGATRGAFFFKKGKLVDARMGPFTGFSAVNLAVSMQAASLSFDPSIQPPASVFNLLNERIILKERFGIDTGVIAPVNDSGSVAESPESAIAPAPQAGHPEATLPRRERVVQKDAIRDWDQAPGRTGPSSVVDPLLVPLCTVPSESKSRYPGKGVALVDQFLQGLSLINHTQNKVFVRAALILSIIIPAAVGIASLWSLGQGTPLEAVPPPAASAMSTPAVVSPVSHTDDKRIVTKAPIKETRLAPQPATIEGTRPLRSEETKLPPAEGTRPDTQAVSNADSEGSSLKEKPEPLSRPIAVVVEINEGHVINAYIENRQAGLGAYEATALRLARQRRYRKDTKRKETLILQVTSEP